ncbi:MAG: hypothetical protein HIU93_07665 [Acidobacteria bacterium]|nr:hypothetical protein [Acidobacteriota bacterium]
MPKSITSFDDPTIQALFGHEAAEQEDLDRLRQYYFKGPTYKRMIADMPLRILVGQKGIGKSALLTVARAEDQENGEAVLFLRPEDVEGIGDGEGDFVKLVSEWKRGLSAVIQDLAFQSMGLAIDKSSRAIEVAGQILSLIKDTAKPFLDKQIDRTPIQRSIAERFLQANRVTVYVDDLDRGWEGKRGDIRRLSAFLIAIKDLSARDSGIRFRVAIRSDVFYAVRKSEPDTDKLESSLIWQSWSNHEILLVLVKRILTFFDEPFLEADLKALKQFQLANYLDRVMTKTYLGQGKWRQLPIHRFLMTMVRQRPRDLVKLCSSAARRAEERGGSMMLLTNDFADVLENYSAERIQDALNEHRLELPDIERLLLGMKPNNRTARTSQSYTFKTDALLTKLQNLISQGTFKFATGQFATSRDLADFLYKIDFVIARKTQADGIDRKYFEHSRYLSSTFVDFGYDWEIHPAYRWALQPGSVTQLFEDITPSSD